MTRTWHPFAERFPLLGDEALDDMAADILMHGQREAIKVLPDGTGLDGRNREEACSRAGVVPEFEIIDPPDPIAYILSANAHRRHLTQGQKAMGIALGSGFSETTLREWERRTGVDHSRIAYALVVIAYAPDLVDQVMVGGSLNDAYAVALENKRRYEAADAARSQEAINRARATVKLLMEEIGEPIEIPSPPALALTVSPDEQAPDPAPGLETAALKDLQTRLRALIAVRTALEAIVKSGVPSDVWWLDGHVNAVRSAVTHIVATAYAIAENHNAALAASQRTRLRKVE